MKRAVSLLLCAAAVLSLCACGKENKETDENTFRVVTSFYPVYVAALNIMDGAENTSLTNLTKPNLGCMHDYALTTEDMKKLTNADVFIVNGQGMETFIGNVSLGIPGLVTLESGEDIPVVIEEDEGETRNPHYWMNIDNAIAQAEKIEQMLSSQNAENEGIYKENLETYRNKLLKLKEEASSRMAKYESRDMVLFHESFDYFAREFGLNVVSVISNHDGSAPSPQKLAETVEFIKSKNIKAVFTESQFDTSVADTVAREAGCEVYVLDTLTSGEIDDAVKDAYINAVHKNLDTLERAFG